MKHQISKTIKKEEYVFAFSFLTIKKYCDIKSITVSEFDQNIEEDGDINTLFRAAVDVATKGEVQIDEYEMDELLNEISDKDFVGVYKCYLNSVESIAVRMATVVKNIKVKKK